MVQTIENNLIGSERQLDWAYSIRSRFLEQLHSLSETHQFTFDNIYVITGEEIRQMNF